MNRIISEELWAKLINFLKGDRDGWGGELAELRNAPVASGVDRAIEVAIRALKWAANQGEQVDEEEAKEAITTLTPTIQPRIVTREGLDPENPIVFALARLRGLDDKDGLRTLESLVDAWLHSAPAGQELDVMPKCLVDQESFAGRL